MIIMMMMMIVMTCFGKTNSNQCLYCLGGAKLNIVILWGGKAIKAHNGVLGYTLSGFFWNLGALRSHLVPSGCPQRHLWTCLIRYYFWSFIFNGDRDGNLSMLYKY